MLQLIRLVRILQHEGVQEAIAADLEFDVGCLGGFLDARGWVEMRMQSVNLHREERGRLI